MARFSPSPAVFLLVAMTACWDLVLSKAWAEVKKPLHFESVPAGAEVFVKQGTRELSLGKTPLIYEAEFHSEMSILRIGFKKKLYKPLTLEVSAKDDKVVATLAPLGLTADPATISDPQLRAVQERINPLLEKLVPELLGKDGPFEVDLAEPIFVHQLEKAAYVEVPLRLSQVKTKLEGSSQTRQDVVVKGLWEQLGPALIIPLSKALRNQHEVKGVALRVDMDEQRFLFGVESHVESRTEMECVAGYDQVLEYDACAYYVNGNCRPGNKMQSKHNPCQFRRPVTKSEVKISPQATTDRNKVRAGYFFELDLLNQTEPSDHFFSQLNIMLIDSKGSRPFAENKSDR